MSAAPKRKPPQRGKKGGRTDQHRVTLRLFAEEWEQAKEKSSNAGLSVAGYFRAAGLGNPGFRSPRRLPVDRALVTELLVKTSRIGGNLYQLSRSANFGELVNNRAIADMLQDLRALTNEIRAMLGRKPV